MTANLVAEQLQATVAGYVRIRNSGGYIARFQVSYDYGGKSFSKDSGNFTAGVNKSIDLPAGATNIVIKCEEMWFIDSWSSIFTQTHAQPGEFCYDISGTTLAPSWKQVSCG